MSQIFLALIIGRIAERLLVTSGALLAMFFGWQLFKSGVVIQQTATGEFRGAKVVLSKVGPGIFFALFSTIVLVYALRMPLHLGRDEWPLSSVAQADLTSETPTTTIEYLGPDQELDFVRAVNAVSASLVGSKDRRVKQALPVLEASRLALLTKRFSATDVQFYLKNTGPFHVNPNDYTPLDQKRLKTVDDIAASQFDD